MYFILLAVTSSYQRLGEVHLKFRLKYLNYASNVLCQKKRFWSTLEAQQKLLILDNEVPLKYQCQKYHWSITEGSSKKYIWSTIEVSYWVKTKYIWSTIEALHSVQVKYIWCTFEVSFKYLSKTDKHIYSNIFKKYY